MNAPRVVEPPDRVYRLGRADDPLRYSEIPPEDIYSNGGNRFDIPGAGVLYAASSRRACFGETIARFRPSPTLPRALLEPDGTYMNVGTVPIDWRLKRRMVELSFPQPSRFLDVDAPETHRYLGELMAPHLRAMGVSEPLDISSVRGRDRRLTRAIASHVYMTANDDGEFLYDGIAYTSKLDNDWTCWAIFANTPIDEVARTTIESTDPDLCAVAEQFGLHPF